MFILLLVNVSTISISFPLKNPYILITYCRGPFFLLTADQVQKPRRFALRAQNLLGPVICSNEKVKRNGFKPLTKPIPGQPT